MSEVSAGRPSFVIQPLTPADVDYTPPLLRSLITLMRLKGKTVSTQFLLSKLAGASTLTPTACIRAMEHAGLRSSILYRKNLATISLSTLPCVLLLRNDASCVYTAQIGSGTTDAQVEVIFPESNEVPQCLALASLEADYSGYALFASLEERTDKRAEQVHFAAGKRWFWDVLTFYAPIYRHVAFASVIINFIGLLSPLFVMNVYDRVVPNNATDTLWVLAIGIGIAYLFDFILRSLRNNFVDVAGWNADVILSSMLINKVLTMRLDARPESTGALVNNVREFESLREFFSSSTLLACIDLPFLLCYLALLTFIGGPLVILPLLVMPVLLGMGVYMQTLSKRNAEQNYKQNMHKNALLVEMVNGIEAIKSSMAESRMQRLWEAVTDNTAKTSTTGRKYTNLAIGFSTVATQLATVFMVVWGVYLIGDGTLTMGGLIGCNILLGRAMAPIMQMASLLTRLQHSRISLQALDAIMALPSENQDEKACVDFGSLAAAFNLENVSFAYPGSEQDALKDVSLVIRQGEKVAIIGPMGSGKSTLGKLLVGLYPLSRGAIRLGGVDIHQLATSDLRGRVGFLPQEVVLFYGTVRDNIALGDPSVNEHLILRAANLAGVTDFIREQAAGFATQVGEQGRALSGGQRQAVALARALIRDPDLLILDEPTSNMDNASELLVQRRLQSVLRGKTLIVITHRMSLLDMVDRVIVLEHGRVVADGPKQAVLEQWRARTDRSKAH